MLVRPSVHLSSYLLFSTAETDLNQINKDSSNWTTVPAEIPQNPETPQF